MTPTLEQQAVLDAHVSAGNVLKLIAYAGTGKTHTLVELAKTMPNEAILYVAFNKSVAEEAAMRFPVNTLTRTGHSIAYQAVGRKFGRIASLQNWQVAKVYSLSIYEATLLVRTLESYLNSAEDQIGEEHVEPDRLERFQPHVYAQEMVEKARCVWLDLQAQRNGLAMTHSGYMKLFQLARPVLEQSVILLDEAQDTNPVMLRILLNQIENGARVYLVGDPYQQIYSWRGALDAMTKIECPALWLTQSWRFGPAIAALATKLLKQFFNEEHPVQGLTSLPSQIGTIMEGPYTVICRTNARLVEVAYSIALQGKPFTVIGDQSFQETLATLQEIHLLYMGRRDEVTEKRIWFHRSFNDLKAYAEETLDVELLSKTTVVEEFGQSWPQVLSTLKSKYTTHQEAWVTLTTCHKAKGLEWSQVMIADDFEELFDEKNILRQLSRKDKNLLHPEEINLLYVACTRAKERLAVPSTVDYFLRKNFDQE